MDIAIIYSILFALQGILIYLTHRTAYAAVRDLNILDHRQDFLAARLDSIDNRLDYLKIIENAEELHIFEEELYLLLLELNLVIC